MTPAEIFDLIIKADEKLKYSTDANMELRRRQAIELLLQARSEAQAAGVEQLVQQAQTRLRDLDAEPPEGEPTP
jgi:hypothetical protein